MQEVKYLLAKGFTFEEIAHACGLSVLAIYCAYLGTANVPEVCEVYRYYQQTGMLPSPQPEAAGERQ